MTNEEILKEVAYLKRQHLESSRSLSWQEQYRERYAAKLAKIAAGDYCQYCKLLSPGDDHECLGMRFSRPIKPAGLRMPFEWEAEKERSKLQMVDMWANVEGYPI